ncbi:DUF6696 domain-containing protein [Stenotrophomonas sp. C3(2023)]|uniref:XVIPCD domain-containing protein n=1 Tax=Stenotrophomonas sp. C3(2023) TaxID=3080277 RepID=UPI00293C48F3|nr:XVIPCD domain-containing protein [Stenotrophomonas sp. C3(2023)]MDV3469066.1 DUF6696 domain-containing protein [Stenotrophomonas sp. C3(2023)]
MSDFKLGLNAADVDVLKAYVAAGNRELYFNYLAQKQGNDGYGLLALGVIRNDNAPGATANSFADRQARADGVYLNERDWQAFGVDLMKRDLALREAQLAEKRPDLALNLPVKDVQKAHDEAFRNLEIDPSAWTPYKLLVAAQEYGGDAEAEAVWSILLDNSNLGMDRGFDTMTRVVNKYRALIDDPAGYLRDMVEARQQHVPGPVSNIDPDRILREGRVYHYSDTTGWLEQRQLRASIPIGVVPVPLPSMPISPRAVTDPATLSDLEAARDVRLERARLRQQFHPDDPNRERPILRSPYLLSDAQPAVPDAPVPVHVPAPIDFTAPDHPRHALWQQCCEGVRGLDAGAGKPWDEISERLAGSLTALAVAKGLDRVDHVVLSGSSAGCPGGDYVFVVQGRRGDLTSLRERMSTLEAVNQPLAQSFEQAQASERELAEQLAQQRVQELQDLQMRQQRRGPLMGG